MFIGQQIIKNVHSISIFQIGDITFTGKIERTIEFRGEIYLLGENQFVKLDIQKNVAVVKLAPAIHRNISEYQLYVK